MSYAYSGAHNGIECGDGSTAGFTRTTPDGAWTYARTLGTGNASTTTVTDPLGNQTVLNFQKDGAATNNTLTFYETYRNVYQGSSGSGTLLMTTFACYNNNANGCPNPTAVSSPITKTDYYTQHPGLSGSTSETTINSYGLPTDNKDFDFGTVLKRELVYTYPTNLGNIKASWQTVTTKDAAGNIIAQQPTITIKPLLWPPQEPRNTLASGATRAGTSQVPCTESTARALSQKATRTLIPAMLTLPLT